MMNETNGYDVVVVGGGVAGLSAAVTLGRARRSVVVVDAGAPRNAPAAGVHGFLTRDGLSPLELVRLGRAEAESYGAVIVEGTAVAVERIGDGFAVTLADGSVVRGRRLLVATGLVDELPEVEGLRERWGKDVLHCPYCHGWEVQDRAIGIIATGPMAVHQALMWGQWSSRVTLLLHNSADPGELEWEQLAARGVSVVDGTVASVTVTDDALRGVVLEDGTTIALDALVTGTRLSARTDFLAGLGAPVTEHPMGVGTLLESDPVTGATGIAGVWSAGNVTDLMAQVVVAAAAGLRAGTAINADLITAEVALAVDQRRARAEPPFSAEGERANHQRLAGSSQHGIAPVRSARQHRTPAPAAHQHGTPAAAAHQHGADEHGADEHGAHENAGEGDAPTEYDQAFWDARYAESESIWSGNPNPVLVAEASTLSAGSGSAPRSALDIGSGEGADAIWLAERGWQVTAVDISPVALARAADRASARGVAADQITWEHHDLTAWTPPPARFDLVSAQFMHLPQTQREVLFRDLAAAVADGGTLLIVGHDMVDLDVAHRWNIPGMFYSADELAATLDPTLWHIAAAESRARTVTAQEETVTLHDVVLRAERRRGN